MKRLGILSLCLISCAGNFHVSQAEAAEPPFVFRDVAKEVGLRDPLRGMMGHAAAWRDVDGDGLLDLFVGAFADFDNNGRFDLLPPLFTKLVAETALDAEERTPSRQLPGRNRCQIEGRPTSN